jgi:hypothetical protein
MGERSLQVVVPVVLAVAGDELGIEVRVGEPRCGLKSTGQMNGYSRLILRYSCIRRNGFGFGSLVTCAA